MKKEFFHHRAAKDAERIIIEQSRERRDCSTLLKVLAKKIPKGLRSLWIAGLSPAIHKITSLRPQRLSGKIPYFKKLNEYKNSTLEVTYG